MSITMEIPDQWLADVGFEDFKPTRSAIRCAVQHELISIAEIEPLVRSIPLDANGFRRSKMIAVLEMIRDDVPSTEPIYVARQLGRWPYHLRDGVHRYYASRALGFTHVPAEIIDPSY
jgi:hypothetical protein